VTCECCHYTAVTCEKPPPSVIHGKVLFSNEKTHFYYGDTVEVLCDLGYVIDEGMSLSQDSMTVTCQPDRTWDAAFPNCTGMIRCNFV